MVTVTARSLASQKFDIQSFPTQINFTSTKMDKGLQAVTEMFKKTKFFQNAPKRGETYELKAELNADTKDKRKEAVKKVIANMTIGKDVSMLFADVVKNMQTEDLELKKLVYLYLMNYAKSQPELVILAVNTFVKDSDDVNPLIRALAIRTMGCLRVPKILDYICDPLKKALKDDHPYVRKTAAICVAKLHEMSAQLCYESGMVTELQEMLGDPNPMVVANSVAALLEIKDSSSRKDVFLVNSSLLQKLLTALNECTEWGQIGILEALAAYTPADSREAELVTERVLPRLQHVNASVVMSAIKVLMNYLDFVQNEEHSKTLIKKLAPPLVTLLASPPEVQYVALRNIHLILQKRSDILSNEVRVFFCKFNDPPYVKIEKLEIMIKLASEKNIDQVVSELKEYAAEVDVDFVRKAVQAIGRCAVKIESSAERCVAALLELIQNKVNYVVQEAIVVMKDIFRKYPDRYESIIPTLCENLESLDEPEAKAAMVWIIGENAQRIENAAELIQFFMENFKFETSQVQLQLLTASVKLFIKKPQQGQELVQKILQTTSTSGESADLRDKAFIYLRLLQSDPSAAAKVVLAPKPPIAGDVATVSASLLNDLLKNLATIASIYHKPPSTFLGKNYVAVEGGLSATRDRNASEEEIGQSENVDTKVADLLDLDFNDGGAAAAVPISPNSAAKAGGNIMDLLSGSPPKPIQASSPVTLATSPTGGAQLFSPTYSAPSKKVFLAAEQGKGLQISASFSRRNGVIFMDATVENKSLNPLSDFAIQVNKNSFGLVPSSPFSLAHPLPPNQSAEVSVSFSLNGVVEKMNPLTLLQIAVKNNVDVFYFQAELPLNVFFAEDGIVDQQTYMSMFGDASASALDFKVTGVKPDDMKAFCLKSNIFVLYQPAPTVSISCFRN